MRSMFSSAILAGLLLVSPAFAADIADADSSVEQIRQTQVDLRRSIEQKSGKYSYFTDDDRRVIFARQDKVLALLNGREQLGPDDRAALDKAVSDVDAAVAQAEDNRMICERIKPIGSNRPQSKCMTVGQRRQMREDAQNAARGPER